MSRTDMSDRRVMQRTVHSGTKVSRTANVYVHLRLIQAPLRARSAALRKRDLDDYVSSESIAATPAAERPLKFNSTQVFAVKTLANSAGNLTPAL